MDYLLNQPWDFYVEKGILFFYLVFVYYTLRTRIPLMPTQMAARKVILNILQPEIDVRRGQKIKLYDLGSGFGGLCMAIAKKFPDVEVVGLEMAWPAWLYCLAVQKISGQKNMRFQRGNFWKHDLLDADIIVFYLGYAVMQQMSEKLRADPRPNRLIISNTFPMPKDWVPIQTINVSSSLSREILVYRQG